MEVKPGEENEEQTSGSDVNKETDTPDTAAENPAEDPEEEVFDKPRTIMTIGGESETHTVEHTVSLERPDVAYEKNTVPVKIKYPADYKHPKHFKDGEIREVSQESADAFVKKGFATIVKEKKK